MRKPWNALRVFFEHLVFWLSIGLLGLLLLPIILVWTVADRLLKLLKS